MAMSINPVKAAVKLYEQGDCGIQGLNEACYSVCASFAGVPNAWTIPEDCAKQCEKFTDKLRMQYYGLSKCDHQAPKRPVLWDQIPDYFPVYLRESKDPVLSLKKCMEKCGNSVYPESCREKCKLNSYAVETFRSEGSEDRSSIRKYEKSNPVIFFLFYRLIKVKSLRN